MKQFLLSTGILLAATGCTASTSGTLNGGDTSSRSSAATQMSSESSSVSSINEDDYPPLSDLEKQKAEAYLGSNINGYVKLAPSVLGGTFYMTGIDWYTDNTALVSYEDGHVEGRARVTLRVTGDRVDVLQFTEFPSE